MKIIYIAGPFRAKTAWGIEQNIRRAEEIGLLVAQAGAMPLIPHTNTRFFHGECTEQFWIDGTMELLRRCDAAVFIPGWGKSSGANGEFNEAASRRMKTLDMSLGSVLPVEIVLSEFVKGLR